MTGHVSANDSVSNNYFTYISSRNYEPFYVDTQFSSCKFNLSMPMLADTGADDTIIPIDCLPNQLLEHLTPSDLVTTGVGGAETKSEGCFKCTVRIGGKLFENITVQVMPSKCPPLLGRDILKYPGMSNVGFYMAPNGDGVSMKFSFFDKNGSFEYEEPLIAAPNGPNDILRRIKYSLAGMSSSPELSTLESKLQYLNEKCKINLEHENREYLNRFADLLIEHEDVLGLDGKLGEFPHDVNIPTTGEAKQQKQHPIPHAFRDKVGPALEEMLKDGVIEHCADPKGFHSPIWCVAKKNGNMRLVVNFKKTLNKVLTACDPFQMPSTENCFLRIGNGNKFFSSMDMKAGYWQLRISEEDRYKTAFSWEGRDYQFIRLPFGLTTAGQIFSRAISTALENVTTMENLTVYLDDTLVHAKDFESYHKAHREFFASLRRYNLKLNPAKCQFLRSKVEFLGRMVDAEGCRIVPEYVESLLNMPSPTSRNEISALTGKCVWLKEFIGTRIHEKIATTSFSHLLRELHKLKNQKGFSWPKTAQTAWEKVKERLTTTPVISFPDYRYPFQVCTDASDVACGAVLIQEINGKIKLIASCSHSFSDVEQR